MTAIGGSKAGNDDDVSLADADLVVTAWAAVGLDRLVGLYPPDLVLGRVVVVRELVLHHPETQLPNAAHRTSPTTTMSAAATIAMSPLCFTVARNGL